MLKPVERDSLSNQVYRQLRAGILGETYLAGERLPSERDLCDQLGVNRSSVREAIKRLEQAGLIRVRHGGGSVVLDYRVNGGFDLLRDLIMTTGQVDLVTIRSILELRPVIGPAIARYAARRKSEEELADLRGILTELEACSAEELDRFQELDFEFFHTLARASRNMAFLLLVNSIRDTYLEFREFFRAMFEGWLEDPSIYRRILVAVEAGDEQDAEALSRHLQEEGNRRFWASLPDLEGVVD